MRKTIITLAISGLSVFGFGGVAGAAGHHDPTPPSCTPAAGSTTCTPTLPGRTLPPCTITGTETSCSDPLPARPGFPVGNHFNDRFNGHVVILDGGPQLDVCSSPDYSTFVLRNQVYRDRFGTVFGPNPQARFVQLHQACNTTTNTTVDGNCTTVTTAYQNYTDRVNRWNSLATQYRGLRVLNTVQIGQLRSLQADRDHWRDVYLRGNNVRTTSNTTCSTPTTINNITVQEAPAACGCAAPSALTAPVPNSTPATVTEQAPAPVYVNPAPVPNVSKGIDTGDGSVPLEQW